MASGGRQGVLEAIRDSDVRHGRSSEPLTKTSANSAVRDAVFHPQMADGRVLVGKGETVRPEGVGETGRAEIQAVAFRSCPADSNGVQERSGHTDISLTLRSHSRFLPDIQEEAAERSDPLLIAHEPMMKSEPTSISNMASHEIWR